MPWVNGKNTWLDGLEDYQKESLLEGIDPTTGLYLDRAGASISQHSAILSGEVNDYKGDGVIFWEGSFTVKESFSSNLKGSFSKNGWAEASLSPYHPDKDIPDKLFDLDINSNRYKACLSVAQKLKKDYPLTGLNPNKPEDYAKIVRNEEIIADTLIGEIHRQYGNYNKNVAKGSNSSTDPTMHNDTNRAVKAMEGSKDIPSLKEFRRGELICRQYAALTSRLLTETGVANFQVFGKTEQFSIKQDKLAPYKGNTESGHSGHDYVVSRLTGNIFESTPDVGYYALQVSNISMNDLLSGRTIVIANNDSMRAYGTGYTGSKKSVADYDFEEAQKIFDASKGKFESTRVEKLLVAAEKGDVNMVVDCCKDFPFSKTTLAYALTNAVFNQNLPLSEFLIDHGALEGYDNSFKNVDLFFKIKNTKLDPLFVGGLANKLHVSPEECLKNAKNKERVEGCYDVFHTAFQSYEIIKHGATLSSNIQATNDVSPTVTNYVPTNVPPVTLPMPSQKQH